MAGSHSDELDIRTEMRIALFWRGILGDGQYGAFEPEDMLRWYFALELRGADEIRDLWNERYFSRAMGSAGAMVGVVSAAPHPPLWVVKAWMEHHEEKTQYAVPVALGFSFISLSFISIMALHGCVNLVPVNPLAMHPPAGGAKVQGYVAGPPGLGTAPGTTPQTANLQTNEPAPTRGGGGGGASVATVTGPQTGGIAGGAAATSATSPTGSGISASGGH